MKKYKTLIVLLAIGHLLFAQKDTVKKQVFGASDTNLKGEWMVKINPGLLFSEQGLMLQYGIQNNFALMLGAGYNEDNTGNQNFSGTGGHGYTIRAGVTQYLDNAKKFYFSFQGFYRNYGKITAVAQHAEGFTQGIDDEVLNPLRQNIGSVSVGDGNRVDVYRASVTMLCFDAVMGYQYRKNHFVFDVFGGLGSRSKSIHLHETGYYSNPFDGSIGAFTPYGHVLSKNVHYNYVDMKLGFTLGYRLY